MTFYVLNSRDMLVGEFDTREDAEMRALGLRERGFYGCHVVPPRGGYPSDLTDADLEQKDAPDEDEE